MTTDSSVLEDQIREAFRYRADNLPKAGASPAAFPVTDWRRRNPRSVALVAAIVVIVLVVAVVGLVRVVTDDTRPAHRPAVSTTLNPDLGAAVSQQSLGGIRTTRNGRGLRILFVGGAPYTADNPCSVRYQATQTETRTAVHVRLVGFGPTPGALCNLVGYGRQATVMLHAPLDGRRVTVNLARQPVFDGSRLAQPSWVPSGFKVSDDEGGSGTTWTRTWSPPVLPLTDGHCTPTVMSFGLTQGPDTATRREALAQDLAASDQTLQSHPAIGTATGDYYASIHEQTLTWNHGDQNYTLTTVPPCGSYTLTPLADVLHFARSLQLSDR